MVQSRRKKHNGRRGKDVVKMYKWEVVKIIKKKERTKGIQVRLTEEELEMIKEVAKGKGKTISEQIRKMIHKEYEEYHLFDPVPPEIYEERYGE